MTYIETLKAAVGPNWFDSKSAVYAEGLEAQALPSWYEFKALDSADGVVRAELSIVGPIGSYFGVDCAQFCSDLAEVEADEILVKLNSPGGRVYDGITIYNALRDHPAKIHIRVEALAASIAAVIAMAGDTVTMNRLSEMMIHKAWGVVIGNADELGEVIEQLDRQDRKQAVAFKARAGGSINGWLALMGEETWYTGHEAVAAGLADVALDPEEDEEDDDDTEASAHQWDLSMFVHAGRAEAPDPFEKITTGAAPDPAPDDPPAAEAADGDLAAARQRKAQVAIADAELALAQSRAKKREALL